MAQDMVFKGPGRLEMKFRAAPGKDGKESEDELFHVHSRGEDAKKWCGLAMFNTEEVCWYFHRFRGVILHGMAEGNEGREAIAVIVK